MKTSFDSMNGKPEHIRSKDEPASQSATEYLGVGISTGLAIGVALGAAFDDMGLGIALGVAFGAAFGAGGSMVKEKK